jgi:hypothetical protein
MSLRARQRASAPLITHPPINGTILAVPRESAQGAIMSRIGLSRLCLLISLSIFLVPATTRANAFAAAVLSYTPGAASPLFQTPAAALGAPDALSGENPAASNYFGFPNVLSPFSAAYQGDEIVQIGEGGQLTLRLSNYVNVGPGKRLGVLTNAALQDSNFLDDTATNSNPAQRFGGGSATVRVSDDGVHFISLGTITFDIPNLYFANAGPYDPAAPANPVLADFGLPFPGALSDFNGKDYAATVDAFKIAPGTYSGGGTWLDLSPTGLTQVGYIQFELPDDNNPLTTNTLALDSISIANPAIGAPLPEPTLLVHFATAFLFLRRRH